MQTRAHQRPDHELRAISFTRHFTNYAEGSVLATFGNTKVLCNASLIEGVPRFLRDRHQGWLTAEYSMLPRSTYERTEREAVRGHQGGRTIEIQRLIGRALRAAVDLSAIENYTITIDCDVIQADGGTRTAAISGASVALVDALHVLQERLGKKIKKDPLKTMIAAVSVGICNDRILLDLDYAEDSSASTDMNMVMTDKGSLIEMQGTAEQEPFSEHQLAQMIALAKQGIAQIIKAQQEALKVPHPCG